MACSLMLAQAVHLARKKGYELFLLGVRDFDQEHPSILSSMSTDVTSLYSILSSR